MTDPRGAAPSPTPAGPLRAMVEELVLAGVRDVVVCPGSRSTPLALALAVDPAVRIWLHLDERAGGFFALGLAAASRRAVGILVTSGTALANLHPAVVEASQGRLPLVVLSADRPPELRDRGAPQSIDQDRIFGRHVKWFAELPVPGDDPVALAHLRSVVSRAVAVAGEVPAGPVQVNLPFREPLIPDGDLRPGALRDDSLRHDSLRPPAVRLIAEGRLPAEADLAGLADRLRAAQRPLIVCGPLDRPGYAEAVAQLAGCIGAPILADGLANLRMGSHDRSQIVARGDTVLRSERFRSSHRPDLVLRFGGTPTSKTVLTWLASLEVDQIVVDDGGWIEPTIRPVTMVHADPVRVAARLADRLAEPAADGPTEATAKEAAADAPAEPGADRPTELAAGVPAKATASDPAVWLAAWQIADHAADHALRAWLGALREPFEGAVIVATAAALPDGALLYVGNSMPVRDLDGYLPAGPRTIRCLGNRGANGIDGVVSSALGAAAADVGPVVLIVGDVSFLHDLNALLAARLQRLSATIVLVNNDGGGIFSFLPQATEARAEVGLPEQFEALFGTPHGVEPGPIVAALGGEHRLVSMEELTAAVAASVGQPGVRVLEIRTERRRNVELHRDALAAAVAAVEAAVPG